MKDESLSGYQPSEKGTFIIHIQCRKHATWQGTVVWADKKQSKQFRSALELLKLMDDALENSGVEKD